MLPKLNDARFWLLLLLSQLLVVFCHGPLVAQIATVHGDSASAAETKAQGITLYTNAHPYPDDAPIELKKAVPELKSLKVATSQPRLQDVLATAAVALQGTLSKCPNLVSDEEVTEKKPRLGEPREFNDILIRRGNDDRLLLKEYRTTVDGQPASPSDIPFFQGFASSWLFFSASNQPESRFCYLGEQKVDGRQAYVVAFAQIPGEVKNPGYIIEGRRSIPMLLQGIAWIDQVNSRIIRYELTYSNRKRELDTRSKARELNFTRHAYHPCTWNCGCRVR